MSFKAITIYTPSGTAPHIAAEDDAFIFDSLLGGRSGILGDLTCVRVDDNTVRLAGGGVSNRGFAMYIPQDNTHTLSVANGTQGAKRHDLVVAEFTKNGGDVADEHCFKIVQGTAAVDPTDPELVTSTLATSGDVNQMALFRVVLDGLEITAIEQIADNAGDVPVAEAASSCTGNSATATRLQTARTLTLTGDASGSASFDGTENVTISTTVSTIDGRAVYVQSTEPESPSEGDLWFW